MTTVNSTWVAKMNIMQQIIQMSSLVVYEMGGVIVVKALNIDERVNIVVMLIATRPGEEGNKQAYLALAILFNIGAFTWHMI